MNSSASRLIALPGSTLSLFRCSSLAIESSSERISDTRRTADLEVASRGRIFVRSLCNSSAAAAEPEAARPTSCRRTTSSRLSLCRRPGCLNGSAFEANFSVIPLMLTAPLGLPAGLPDCPFLKRVCAGGGFRPRAEAPSRFGFLVDILASCASEGECLLLQRAEPLEVTFILRKIWPQGFFVPWRRAFPQEDVSCEINRHVLGSMDDGECCRASGSSSPAR